MKRFALIAAFALALPFVAAAQDKPADKPAPKEHTMTGCLATGTTDNSYIVNSTAEKGPKTIGIVSSEAKLAPHVGHKIDITGVGVPNKEAESLNPAPPKADHYMKISAIKMVAAKCP